MLLGLKTKRWGLDA